MNRISQLFERKQEKVLNIYLTAGYPHLDSLVSLVPVLEKSGVDIIEVGMPYSDPLADGETIQLSSKKALENGMTLDTLFDQVKVIRQLSEIPIILMGYFNQMIQYGDQAFLRKCKDVGVDGLIIPDLPMYIYEDVYEDMFADMSIGISFLVTPQTSSDRIKQADKLSTDFLYVVSRSSITGSSGDISDNQKSYFSRLNNMGLASQRLIGFGIHDKSTFDIACQNANGAIIGSAMIRALSSENTSATEAATEFVRGIL